MNAPPMLINADFSRRAVVTPDQYRWVASPQGGVERVMLDRVGAEQARATSIVRYAPGAWFPQHAHPGGEEILVLAGTFSEGDAHHGAGSYMRNPPASSHQPHSREGATLFVKLRQMRPQERQPVRIDTRATSSWRNEGGRELCPLFADATERVCLRRLAADETLFATADEIAQGAELLVLDGSVTLDGQPCGSGSWARLPAGDHARIVAGAPGGALLYLKTGPQAGLPTA